MNLLLKTNLKYLFLIFNFKSLLGNKEKRSWNIEIKRKIVLIFIIIVLNFFKKYGS